MLNACRLKHYRPTHNSVNMSGVVAAAAGQVILTFILALPLSTRIKSTHLLTFM